MLEKDFNDFTETIKSKLGEESTALIADDLGIFITKAKTFDENMTNRDNEISTLKDTNSKLVSANGRLLQQIPMGKDNTIVKSNEKSEEHKAFNFMDAFDEKGNFKRKM